MASQEMIRSKYVAIKEFYNQLSLELDLKLCNARNFIEIVNQQLEFILPLCEKEYEPTSSVVNRALSVLKNSTFISYKREIDEARANKGDEEELGKILVAIMYEVRVRQPKVVQKTIQSILTESQLEMIHIIKFLETREEWPIVGSWAAILRIAMTPELQEEWNEHENSLIGDIENCEPLRPRHSLIPRTPVSRTPANRRRKTAHGSPMHDVLYSPLGQERMRVAELQKEVAFLTKKNMELLRMLEENAEETDKERESLIANAKIPSVNYELNSRGQEILDLKLRLSNVERDKSELESTKKRLERELDAAQLNAFELRQRCNDLEADLCSESGKKDKLSKEVETMKESMVKLMEAYDSRGKALTQFEDEQAELNKKLHKKFIDYNDLEESYGSLQKELRNIGLRSIAEREEYAAAVRANYETEIARLKTSIDATVAEAVKTIASEKAALEANMIEIMASSETIKKEAEIRVSNFKDATEKAQRDVDGLFKESIRAKETIQKLDAELFQRVTTIAELHIDFEEQELACFKHETELAEALQKIAAFEAETESNAKKAQAAKLRHLVPCFDFLPLMSTFEVPELSSKPILPLP